MNDEQLRNLFSSLAVLAQQGPIPVQAFSMLVHNHSPEALAEQLHQRWLSDGRFAQIAATIIIHIHRFIRLDMMESPLTDSSGMALSSCTLGLLLNDYRNKEEVRNHSRLMFRNSVKAMFEMYRVYVEIDACVSKCLVKPMLNCLEVLIDENPDAEDVETMAILMTKNGSMLNELNSYFVDRLVVKIRAQLCSDEPFINADIRRIFLHVIDLWSFGWNELMIPESLTLNYTSHRDTAFLNKAKLEKKEFGSKESIV
uniref:C6 transcription factor n=1 Tax=Heterorhabditis bacteriophora TaxID=37862 RepID=A0A1I7XU23_HETBA